MKLSKKVSIDSTEVEYLVNIFKKKNLLVRISLLNLMKNLILKKNMTTYI